MFLLKQSKLAVELIESGKYPGAQILDVRKRDLKRGLRLSGSYYVFIGHETFMIELEINPDDMKAAHEKYILFSTDENKSYYQKLTINDNLMPKGNKILLEFIDPLPNFYYSLKVESSMANEMYFVFENMPFDDLMRQ